MLYLRISRAQLCCKITFPGLDEHVGQQHKDLHGRGHGLILLRLRGRARARADAALCVQTPSLHLRSPATALLATDLLRDYLHMSQISAELLKQIGSPCLSERVALMMYNK